MSGQDRVAGYLEVGTNGVGEVIVNHPKIEIDAEGVGHLAFSPSQARHFANTVLKHADIAEAEARGMLS